MTRQQIVGKLKEVAACYPPEMIHDQMADISRIAFNISLSIPVETPISEAAICDIGGGIGLFSVGCAALGFGKVILVDDFQDQINQQMGESIFSIHRHLGVTVTSRDVFSQGLGNLGVQLDVITSFDSMEHWHHSPKPLFHELMGLLKPSGLFVLGVPNCVNLRKRLTVPLGHGKWSSMHDWYEPTVFRGHVREPDMQDLLYIAKDLRLENVRILGRNWLGYSAQSGLLRLATRLGDFPLRLKPSLCSNLYLVGNKPRGWQQIDAG
jgi:2-polyprenyl-3-methyl-5-hydroxy-6-metoxy-1,4-benzoquinol methylase